MTVGKSRHSFYAFVFLILISVVSTASVLKSPQLLQVQGVKYPNSVAEGYQPVYSTALAPRYISDLGGFNELLPYVTPSPDQEDANSCMLMSLTGAVEWWLHRLTQTTNFTQNGPLDLSERWWMNLSNYANVTENAGYWFTDAIYIFNEANAALNRNYPFAKGWYHETEDDIVPATSTTPGAQYGARYNWIDDIENVKGPFIELPPMGRKVLFRNREKNPWAIGTAPENIVQKVIEAFQKYKSPIQVIYNHEGYWHAVYVIGYDEEMSSQGCPFTTESMNFYQLEVDKSYAEGDRGRAKKFLRYKKELYEALQRGGGCQPKGMFYVRDSQYSDPSEPIYVYDPLNPKANKPYSKRIVLREFDWIRTMANHVTVIYPAKNPGSHDITN